MPNSTTATSITDRALQLLGYSQIASTQQVGNRGAKSLERAYTSTKLAELQKHFWHFSIKRALLPASATPPVHTKKNAFPLPPDYIMLAPQDQEYQFPQAYEWIMESGAIITDDQGPLKIRYVSSETPESQFDALFAEALSAALAISCGEELTNSQAKLDRVSQIYVEQIEMAKKRGSILSPKPRLPASSWLTSRV